MNGAGRAMSTAIQETSSTSALETARVPQKPERQVDTQQRLRDLRAFYRTGRRPAWARPIDDLDLLPVLMQPYRDLLRVRLPYPVCWTDDGLSTLSDLFDGMAERIPHEGDERAKRIRDLHRIEAVLRDESCAGMTLSTAWEASIERLARASDDDELPDRMRALRRLLQTDGPLLDCGPDAVLQVFGRTAARYFAVHAASLQQHALSLRMKLEDILQAEHRVRWSADEDHAGIDAARLRDLVEHSHLDNPLPPDRRRRLVAAAKDLAELEQSVGEIQPLHPVVNDEIEAYLSSTRAHLARIVRILQTAELEAAGQYRPDQHGGYFDSFGWRDVSLSDLDMLPHPILIVEGARADAALQSELLRLLETDIPVKLFVLLPDPVDASLQPDGWSRLAGRAALASSALVAQATASDPLRILADVEAALRTKTPALVAVYAATFEGTVSPFLASGAARDSRIVPSFRFDVSAGPDWASRFDAEGNPQPESLWPSNNGKIAGGDDIEGAAFTAVDFLALDARFRDEFLVLPEVDDGAVAPLSEWLADDDPSERRVPYIVMADPDGATSSVAVSHAAAAYAARSASWWRTLQELAGINNSHARRLAAAERTRIIEEKKADLEAARRSFEEQLGRATSAVARDIVTNIASGLLSLPESNGRAPAPSPPGAAPRNVEEAPPPKVNPDPAEEPEEKEVPEEEEDALTFDDPYIDTPLCTTCNECTNINGQIFAYDENKQAYIADADSGSFRDLVRAAELCPVHIIHPGKPRNPNEEGLDDLIERARLYT